MYSMDPRANFNDLENPRKIWCNRMCADCNVVWIWCGRTQRPMYRLWRQTAAGGRLRAVCILVRIPMGFPTPLQLSRNRVRARLVR